MWEIRYYHHLADHNALVEWVKGTRLRPYLTLLEEERGAEFENEIVQKAKESMAVLSLDSAGFSLRQRNKMVG